MKKLIRSSVSKLYLRDGGDWTDSPSEAITFSNFGYAISAVRLYQIEDAELIMQIGDQPSPQFDVVVPFSLRMAARTRYGEAAR